MLSQIYYAFMIVSLMGIAVICIIHDHFIGEEKE